MASFFNHFQVMYSFAHAICLLLPFTAAPHCDRATAPLPPEPLAGTGPITKSSPSAFLTAGIIHRPPNCIAANPLIKAVGSYHSVGEPRRTDPSWFIFPSVVIAAAASGML